MDSRGLNQTALSRLSGLSRARVGFLLKEASPSVRDSTERKLCNALGLPEGGLNVEGAQTRYLETVGKQHDTLDLAGLGIVSADKRLPMDRGFARITLREVAKQDSRVEGGGIPSGRIPETKRKPQTFCLGEALLRNRYMFVLGDPGSGKTTTLRHIARAYAVRRQDVYSYPPSALVPIFVRLADWAEQLRIDDSVDVIAAALAQLGMADSVEISEWMRHELSGKDLVFLLDGLDEVVEPALRNSLIGMIRGSIGSYPDSRAIITSRSVGFETPDLGVRFRCLQVEPLDTPTIRKFAQEWSAFRHGHLLSMKCVECNRKVEGLRHAILDHPRILPLAQNPMMLTILALLYEAGATLPQRRWDLYQKICEAFLFSWEERKRAAQSGSPDRAMRLDDREVLWILESVALEMQRKDWTIVPRWWLSDHVSLFLQTELSFSPDDARAEADALLWSLQARTGVLVERGPDRYAFGHLAFQEYFAARAILAMEDPVGVLGPRFYHPRWIEVVRLVATQLDRRSVPRLLRCILDDPDPSGRFLHRGLLTALACLTDGAPVHDPDLLGQIRREIVSLGASQWIGIAFDAMDLLSELRRTRLKGYVDEAVAEMMEAAKEFSLRGTYPVLRIHAILAGVADGPESEDVRGSDRRDELPATPVIVERLGSEDSFACIKVVFKPAGDDPEWTRAVIAQLEGDESADVRATCALELKRLASQTKVCEALIASLQREECPQVRAAMAEALSPAGERVEVKRELLRRLDGDSEDSVREACGRALRHAAVHDQAVQEKLVSALRSGRPVSVRAGAAAGLSRCVSNSEVRDLLMSLLDDPQQDERIRANCLRALRRVLPSDGGAIDFLITILSATVREELRRAAAEALSEYAVTGAVDWSELPTHEIEDALASLACPDSEALDALRAVVGAREVRGLGIPREARIGRALTEFRQRIEIMFVFGSSAKGEQSDDSDVDLMIIGDVSLRELSRGLKHAEQELGRQVNAVVYTAEEWRSRHRDGSPFARRVMSQEKKFIVGGLDELTAMVA